MASGTHTKQCTTYSLTHKKSVQQCPPVVWLGASEQIFLHVWSSGESPSRPIVLWVGERARVPT